MNNEQHPYAGRRVFICRDSVQDKFLDELQRELAALGADVVRGNRNLPPARKHYTADERRTWFADTEVAVMTVRHSCDAEMLSEAPKLRGVCFPAIGVESVDIPAADAHAIAIAHNASSINVTGMAESTLMLVLNLLYQLRDSENRIAPGAKKPDPLKATTLRGKTVGLLGYGRIAHAMAQLLSGFGVNLLTYSPRTTQEKLGRGVTSTGFESLMRDSDVVCVLVSITPESTGLVNAQSLSWMKPGAYLVNTARGAAVDERALFEALRDRKIAGAALDTFIDEPLPADSPLRSLDNVILTPHMVGQTHDSHEEFVPVMLENVKRLLRGELPVYLKNQEIAQAWLAKWG